MSEATTKPDAGALKRMASGIAALFGKTMGADEATLAELAAMEKGDPPPVPPISTELAARLAKSDEDNAALREELRKSNEAIQALRDAEAMRAYRDEAAQYREAGIDPEKDAALLKSVSETLPKEQADRLREILKSATEVAKTKDLFDERGRTSHGVPVVGSAVEKIQQRAAALVSKNDKLTMEDATSIVFREDPALYEAYRKETAVRV